MNEEMISLKKKIIELNEMNNNLYRIMREKSNQYRGLHPKKEHTGYVLLSCTQWTEKCIVEVWREDVNPDEYQSEEQKEYAIKTGLLFLQQCRTICWRSQLQTPYAAKIPFLYVKDRIEHELRETILYSFGCYAMTESSGDYYR